MKERKPNFAKASNLGFLEELKAGLPVINSTTFQGAPHRLLSQEEAIEAAGEYEQEIERALYAHGEAVKRSREGGTIGGKKKQAKAQVRYVAIRKEYTRLFLKLHTEAKCVTLTAKHLNVDRRTVKKALE